MDNNLPPNFNERELDEQFTEEEQGIIDFAEKCGLVYAGRDDEGAITFNGEDKAWSLFNKD